MIDKNNKQDHISVISCVLLENDKKEFLFVKSKNFAGKWWLPGGHVKYGASLEQSALDELKEETSIDLKDGLKYLGKTEVIEPKDYHKVKHFVVFYFHATCVGKQKIVLDKGELSDFRWMTMEKIKKERKVSSLLSSILEDMDNEKSCGSCQEYKTGWARAQADYQNLVKETEKNRSEWAQYSERQILEEFIPVYDNFKTAFSHQTPDSSPELDNWKKGIEYIMKQFNKVLEDHGVIEIRTVGETFDPELHEAISEEKSEEESGKILKEVAVGYRMKDKVIRPAKVVVSK